MIEDPSPLAVSPGAEPSDILTMMAACRLAGAIDLAGGLPPSQAHPVAVQGAVDALRRGENRYTDTRGVPALREAIAARLQSTAGLRYDPDSEVLVASGVTGAFAACAMSLFTRGDEVLVVEPFFGWHVRLLRLAGLTPRFVSLQGEAQTLSPEALRAACGPRTRGLVLCTPSNPGGKLFTVGELEGVAQVARELDLLVITDEQYQDFCYDGRQHVAPASVADLRERTVSLGGFSKSLAVTGWRMAYAAAPARLLEAVHMVHQALYICPATPLQHGVAQALPQADLREERDQLQANRDRLCAALRAAGFEPQVPQGGFFVMAEAPHLAQLTSLQQAMTLLEQLGVAAVPGRAFHRAGYQGAALRFCFARSPQVIDDACRVLQTGAPKKQLTEGGGAPGLVKGASRKLSFRELEGAADRDAAAELAYQVYVQELGILGDMADHEARRLHPDTYEGATVLGAFDGDRLLGCVTLLIHADAPFSSFYQKVFKLDRLKDVVSLDKAVLITRLLVRPEERGGTLTHRLFALTLWTLLGRGATLLLADCQPHLVRLYRRIGLQPFGQAFNYGRSGVGVPLVGAVFDHEHNKAHARTFASMLPPHTRDDAAAARLQALVAEERPVLSRKHDQALHQRALADSMDALIEDSSAVFYGFSGPELLRLLRGGQVMNLTRGVRLIGRGQQTRTVYVVLGGELQVDLESRTRVFGAGQILGEVAYLRDGPRTADVEVSSERASVLALRPETLDSLSEGEPALAARFLGNLARVLAQRLAN